MEQRDDAITLSFLTFRVVDEIYGVPLLSVREITAIPSITRVPGAPSSVTGVMNLRGRIVPVLDLRLRFGMQIGATVRDSCLVVLDVRHRGEVLPLAARVDAVIDVVELSPGQIESAPGFGTAVDTSFLSGMATIADRVILLLDVDRVMTTVDLDAARGGGLDTMSGESSEAPGHSHARSPAQDIEARGTRTVS